MVELRRFFHPSSSSSPSGAANRTDVVSSPTAGQSSSSSAGIENLHISPYGVSEVYCPEDPQVDIVFVHGLSGSPQRTWTAGSPPNEVFWPAQLLPKSLGTVRARILVYGYNADVYAFGGKSASSDFILQHAQTLITSLEADRFLQGAEERPIIWVCHSLGGILVKKTLDYSSDITSFDNESQRSIFVSTYGVVFLGTPHNGADPAKWGKMLESMCSVLLPKKLIDTEPGLVSTLKTQSETLQNINMAFLNIQSKFHLAFFHEALKTNFGPTMDFVVDQTSASPPIDGVRGGIEATHSGICKFASANAPGYVPVVSNIKRQAMDAPFKIPARWAEERDNRARARKAQAVELTAGISSHGLNPNSAGFTSHAPSTTETPSHSTYSLVPKNDPSEGLLVPYLSAGEESDVRSNEPSEPLFIIPSGYRPNKIFVGMKKELEDLDQRLFDPELRERGSACVLLWCLPGGGKTHLARQYVFTQKEKFPGGVFWVRAKSKDEIALGFWDIAQKAGLKDVQDPRMAEFEEDHELFIQYVRSWFQSREQWLLVFDGVTIDSEEEIARLQAFLPDSKNSSIILTSVDKSLANRHRLLDPVAVKVMPLDEDDARKLLFEELNIEKPSKAQLAKATELVQKVEKLPLAIHAIGHVLNETQEPLVKYHIRPYSSDPKLREPYTEIMLRLQQLKQFEALNLMFILSFFREHLPVELVQLGVKGVEGSGVGVKARLPGSNRSPQLNDTFRVLMRYALIERNARNEREDNASQRSHTTSFAESIDTLKIHSVIQSFFLETIKAEGRLAFWLTLAVQVFRTSFNEANQRIKKGAGLVNDYREYEVHGNRLMEHVDRNRVKYPRLESTRTELEHVLYLIRGQLRDRTPASSQESVERQVNQISVFDRTSSSSSAGPETPRESISGINTWGIEHAKHPVDSPIRIRQEVPVAGTYPESLQQPPQEDAGYQTDLEMPEPGEAMTPNLSRGSGRRLVRTSEADEGEWQVVKRKNRATSSLENHGGVTHRTIERKKQRSQYYNGVNGWHNMKPTYPDARVHRVNVERTENRSSRPRTRQPARAGTSEAELHLGQIHRNSPPAGLGGAGSPRLQPVGRGSGSQNGSVYSINNSMGLSYADMTAGRSSGQKTPSQASGSGWMSPGGRPSPYGAVSDDDHWGNLGQHQAPTWLSHDQHYAPGHLDDPHQRPPPPPAQGRSSHSSPGPHAREQHLTNPHQVPQNSLVLEPDPFSYLDHQQQQPIRGRPNPRPIEDLYDTRTFTFNAPPPTSSTRTIRGPTSTSNSTSTHPLASLPYPTSSTSISRPTGYTSQPMSRDTSAHSHQSRATSGAILIADSEPPRSPPPFPYSSPARSIAMPGSPIDGTTATNTRVLQTSPLARPTVLTNQPPHQRTSSFSSPRFVRPRQGSGGDLSAVGAWTVTSPTAAAATMSMSRSSSGPGIIAKGRYLQFGDQEEINVDEAELRAAMQREEIRRLGRPYPERDQMPFGGDVAGEGG